MTGRYPTLGEIVEGLQARYRDVAERYAPGGTLANGIYSARNPGRDDRSAGSFIVNYQGPREGRWHDFATDEDGDMLDLIQLALGTDRKGALNEARSFLGINDETPAQRDLRRREERKAAEERQRRQRKAAAEEGQKRKRAQALWLSAAGIEDTPAAAYLEGRGVGPSVLGRAPRALRFVERLRYRDVDERTGEVLHEAEHPAMVAAIHGPPRNGHPPAFFGVHITWIDQVDGLWTKAPVPKPRKVRGPKKGGFIRLWSGWGPRGGKGVPLSKAPEGACVYIAEGIEDTLSVARLIGRQPGVYCIAAIDLSNFREVTLPSSLGRVVIVADRESDVPETAAKQKRQVDQAAARFRAEGRACAVWRNEWGGKDVNDALQAAREGAA